MTTPANPFQAIFANLGQQLIGDATGDLKSAVAAFGTNIRATPTAQNLTAQGVQLGVTLALSGPATLEPEAIGQLGSAIEALAALL